MEEKNFIIEELKEATTENAEAIRRLVKQLSDNYTKLTDDDIRNMISSPVNHLFVVREEETNMIVGMVTVLIYRIPYAKKAFIEDFVIDNSYRRMGLGTKLFQEAIAFAKSQKVAHVMFTSSQKREASNALYVKLGFQKKDTNVYLLKFTYEKE